MSQRLLILLAFIMTALPLSAQTAEWNDTIPPALKMDSRRTTTVPGGIRADIRTARKVVSPLGEGDATRLIQTLPGVAMAGDGGSAFLVRGGNIGSNVLTLDGVPVYGSSHLLGVTSAVPSEVVREMTFQAGGFEGDRDHFLSSQVCLQSGRPSLSQAKTQLFATTFLLGAESEIPLGKRAGLMVSGRISPLQVEYNAIKGLMKDIEAIRDIKAGAYDFYGKLFYNTTPDSHLQGWVFGSRDRYKFNVGDGIWLGLNGHNFVAAIQYHSGKGGWTHDASLSFNDFANGQDLIAEPGNDWNLSSLTMTSSLKELSLKGKWSRSFGSRFAVHFGAQGKMAIFEPVGQRSTPFTGTLWGQAEWKEEGRYHYMGVLRANLFHSGQKLFFYPEFSLLTEVNLKERLVLALSVDHLVQFYHTLEGLPLGWSMDSMIPADASTPPESAWQVYTGLRGSLGGHHFSAGGYFKRMQDLVHYTEAAAAFSASRMGWKDKVDVGKGQSFGLELMYEYTGERFYGKIAYTLSKTTRSFPNLNDGLPFPAKFDRPHILNMNVEWTLNRHRSLYAAFTYQSGYCESVQTHTYPSLLPDNDKPRYLPYYGKQPNNYRMPSYIRLDFGYNISWTSGQLEHSLQLGVYNVLNRHNPFLTVYDGSLDSWVEISFFPILPNFSYRLSF